MSLERFKRALVTIDEHDTVERAACLMSEQGVGCVLVVRKGRPLGLVTDRDLVVRVLARGVEPAGARIGEYVTYDPITLRLNEGIETAAHEMRVHGVRRLPIVDDEGKVVGIVTADDLLVLLGEELAGVCGCIANRTDATESC